MALRSLDLGRAADPLDRSRCRASGPSTEADTLMGRTPAPERYSHFASCSGSVLSRLARELAEPLASLLHLMDNHKLLSGDDHKIEHIANHTYTEIRQCIAVSAR